MSRKRRKRDDKWVDDLLKLGLGALAIYLLGKLAEGAQPQITRCPYCGWSIGKWARTCPKCRNILTL